MHWKSSTADAAVSGWKVLHLRVETGASLKAIDSLLIVSLDPVSISRCGVLESPTAWYGCQR